MAKILTNFKLPVLPDLPDLPEVAGLPKILPPLFGFPWERKLGRISELFYWQSGMEKWTPVNTESLNTPIASDQYLFFMFKILNLTSTSVSAEVIVRLADIVVGNKLPYSSIPANTSGYQEPAALGAVEPLEKLPPGTHTVKFELSFNGRIVDR